MFFEIPLEPGAIFDRFTILGQSGLGLDIYEARESDGRKLLLQCTLERDPSFAERDDAFAEWFFDNAARLTRLDHPHLIQIYGFGRHEGRFWLATQPAPCLDLFELIGRGRIERQRTLAVLGNVASALDYLHGNGISHGFLTPRDIFVSDSAVLLNIGIQWIVDTWILENGGVPCSPKYCCVDIILGQRIGPPCDVYSLGNLAWLALVGRWPFISNNMTDTMSRMAREDFSLVLGQLPTPVEAVLRRCLRADPGKRWPSATAFIAELQKALGDGHDTTAIECAENARTRGALARWVDCLLRFAKRRE